MTVELNTHAAMVIVLTVLSLILFSQEKLRLETSSFIILIILVLFFSLFPFDSGDGSKIVATDFFLGFGHQALVAISALMILGKGIESTGALKPLIKLLSKHWAKRPKRTFLVTLLISGVVSGFLNNTPIVIMLLPVLISVAMKNKTAPSKILIPVGLVTLIGGMATTIGTSTNILVVSIANDLVGIQFSMFHFALPVLIVGSVGLVYLWLIAPLLLPEREIDLTHTSQRLYNAVLFLPENSSVIGLELSEALKKLDYEVKINKIRRKENQFIIPLPSVKLQIDDALFVSGTAEQLKEYEHLLQGKLHNVNNKGEVSDADYICSEDNQVLAEILVTQGSLLQNASLKATRFAERFNIIVLAQHRLHHPTEKIKQNVSEINLKRGDILLVQASRESLNTIRRDSKLLILENTVDFVSSKRAPLSIAIMLVVVLLAALNILPIAISAVTGAGLMLLSRCVRWRDIAKALNTQVILIVVVSLALGKALIETGGANYLAFQFVEITQGLSKLTIICSLLFIMSVLTNVVSNTAAAVIGTPVAVSIAQQLNAPLEPFILAVLFGANMSYATPIGYQTNLLIYSAGGYKFKDFLKVGIPLTVIVGIGFTIMLALLYDI
ncbi:TrkA domain protein [hydrothermal vent metagenome]|uniref:TrkA domain protein n=1 Tax=hydrothermal vent metagenome TaxID=652676 RepID=A0A3B1AJB3_9ZZZZ